MNNLEEIKRRRTFAIISHPDAGKTTLTEKLLLYGGAIHLAGSVKSRKTAKFAASDWMQIEKERGISVTSSVLEFDYNGARINILDTPGHEDFSEDTYRTLMAVDSAVMVIDAAKGVEAQTKKLFAVCKERNIPIFTFINKLDRFGKAPLDLMEEIENVLGIRSYPFVWPIGIDGNYIGVYNRIKKEAELFAADESHGQTERGSEILQLDENGRKRLGEEVYNQLIEDIDLLDEAGETFDTTKVDKGELTPMFFGSAMTNFGVRNFLEEFIKLAPPPGKRITSCGEINPESDKFSAFVFKIQANMNPQHRDRLAFIRICSGKFQRNMEVFHPSTNKTIKLSEPQQFLAEDRKIVEEAYPGDIVGLFDPGLFSIGDTLCPVRDNFTFAAFPIFPPERFARIEAKDTMKKKQFIKGVEQLTKEGAIQLFKEAGTESYILGAVGQLQFEVFEYRLKNEYHAEILLTPLPFETPCYLAFKDGKIPTPADLKGADRGMFVYDSKQNPVLLLQNEWAKGWIMENNPGIILNKSPLDDDANVASRRAKTVASRSPQGD